MIEFLKQMNPELNIRHITDPVFEKYGKIVEGFDFSECMNIMEKRSIPDTGNIYVASDKEMLKTTLAKDLCIRFYGSMPIQIGYCNGNTSHLNALEYHKCSEIDVAITDLVLILSDIRNIKDKSIASSEVEIFYVPAGIAVELYSTTLHFAPCKVTDQGFKSIIVLLDGTNQQLSSLPVPKCDEDSLLWMKNKWLIAHPESPSASKGAYVGITGDNIEIKYK